MGVHIQWLDPSEGRIGVVRMGQLFRKFGDKYEAVCSIQVHGDEAHLFAMKSAGMTLLSELENLRAEMRKIGVKRMVWERIRNGKTKTVRVRV